MEFILVAVVAGVILGALLYHIYLALRPCSLKENTQAKVIIDHLKNNDSLTAEQAKTLYSIRALRSVVCRLRSAGYNIDMKIENKKYYYSLK